MVGFSVPEDGDIVIREERSDGECIYVLPAVPGIDQPVLSIREEAVAKGLRCAECLRVRVWLAEGRDDFTLIEDFRVA
jgi:hypothetical protein